MKLLFALCLVAGFASFGRAAPSKRATICYYTNWAQYRWGDGIKFLPENIDPNLCTHIVYAFAQIDPSTHTVKNYEWNDDSMIQRVMALKSVNPKLKVICSVGGWNHEKEPRYSNMVQTSATRKIFIDSLMAYLKNHHYDGLDIDWEYPGNRGSPAGDKEKYTTLLQEIRDRFNSGNVTYTLTASVAAGRPVIKTAYEIPKIKNILDWVNLMAYDLHGSWENVTGHSTSMAGVIPTVPDSLNAWLESGMPPNQIALGIATYGRSFTLASTKNVSLGAPAYGPGLAGRYTRAQGFLSYYEVCFMNWTAQTSYIASGANAPFASKTNQWIGYETPESVQYKIKTLVNGHDLRGIAVWALDLDDFGNKFCGLGKSPIIKAANDAMAQGLLEPSIPVNKENDHIQFHAKKRGNYKFCVANPKWKSYKAPLQKWCQTKCVDVKLACPPWMCMCF